MPLWGRSGHPLPCWTCGSFQTRSWRPQRWGSDDLSHQPRGRSSAGTQMVPLTGDGRTVTTSPGSVWPLLLLLGPGQVTSPCLQFTPGLSCEFLCEAKCRLRACQGFGKWPGGNGVPGSLEAPPWALAETATGCLRGRALLPGSSTLTPAWRQSPARLGMGARRFSESSACL